MPERDENGEAQRTGVDKIAIGGFGDIRGANIETTIASEILCFARAKAGPAPRISKRAPKSR